jgi:uncharacterized protein YpmB
MIDPYDIIIIIIIIIFIIIYFSYSYSHFYHSHHHHHHHPRTCEVPRQVLMALVASSSVVTESSTAMMYVVSGLFSTTQTMIDARSAT